MSEVSVSHDYSEIKRIFSEIEQELRKDWMDIHERLLRANTIIIKNIDSLTSYLLGAFAKRMYEHSALFNMDSMCSMESDVLEFMLSRTKKYDPEGDTPFENYVNASWKYVCEDMKAEYFIRENMLDMDEPLGKDSQNNEVTRSEYVADSKSSVGYDDVDRREVISMIYLGISQSIISMFEHGYTKSNNKTRESYYRCFFTEDVAKVFKQIRSIPNALRLYRSMVKTFIDCIMEEKCTSPDDIYRSPFKKKGYFGINQSPEQELDYLPDEKDGNLILKDFPANVYTYYYLHEGKDEGIKPSSAAVSINRTGYRKLFEDVLSVNR